MKKAVACVSVAVSMLCGTGVSLAQLTYTADQRSLTARVDYQFSFSESTKTPTFPFGTWNDNVFVFSSGTTQAQANQSSSASPTGINATLNTSLRFSTFDFSNPTRSSASSKLQYQVSVGYPLRLSLFGFADQNAIVRVTRVSDNANLYSFTSAFDDVNYSTIVNLEPGQYIIRAEMPDALADLPGNSFRDRQTTFSASVINCRCDFDMSGFVDDADFVTFAAAYDQFICDPAPALCIADVNGDGFVDDTDFVTFATEYARFACPSF